ncbi:MAG: hypothetical protein IKY98_01050 [Alphaproteobacteria bacterium]|nr:hypothetical protein [Alphaproteobacteria bacterium]
MKKIILICGVLMMSTAANACGGFVIKGDSGASYCMSKQYMNWYSSYAWCRDQGMKLVDVMGICKRYPGRCVELSYLKPQVVENGGGTTYVWADMALSNTNSCFIDIDTGQVHNDPRTNTFRALCYYVK